MGPNMQMLTSLEPSSSMGAANPSSSPMRILYWRLAVLLVPQADVAVGAGGWSPSTKSSTQHDCESMLS